MPGRKWTKKQRAAQGGAIRTWRPWEHSTGPQTLEGKARSSLNGVMHGTRSKAVAAFRVLDKEYRHNGMEDFDLLGQVENVRTAACLFVAENTKKG